MSQSKPVFLLGQGIRASHVDPSPLLDCGIPVLTSWLAKDLVDNSHPMYFGSPGVYGNRLANKVLWEADHVIAVGNRLSIWNVGYDGLRSDQKLTKLGLEDGAGGFLKVEAQTSRAWEEDCAGWKATMPFLEACHADSNGYINSFRFTAALQKYLKPDAVIVTDNGCNMVPAFQVLNLKPPQRLFSSGGLGEMGCGLPMAIGASFARNKGEVLLLVGDGGMMLNLQELQTIRHHNLPIKIIVFANDGYLMIKHSQNVLVVKRSGTDKVSGVSCPNFPEIAGAFGISNDYVNTWEDYEEIIDAMLDASCPYLVQYNMDPEQLVVPKLNPIKNADGSVKSPQFWDLSPRL